MNRFVFKPSILIILVLILFVLNVIFIITGDNLVRTITITILIWIIMSIICFVRFDI